MIFYILFSSAFLQAVTSDLPCPAKNPLDVCRLKISKNLIPGSEFQTAPICKKLKKYYDCIDEQNIPPHELCGWSLVLSHAEYIIMAYCKDPTGLMWPAAHYGEAFYCFRFIMDIYSKVCKRAAQFMYDMHVHSSPKKGDFITNKDNVEDCAKGIIESECYTFYAMYHCTHIGIVIFHDTTALWNFYLAFCQTEEQYLNLRRSLKVWKKEEKDPRRFWTI